MGDGGTNPFKGRMVTAPVPTRVLHRFGKRNHRIAEIRERTVTMFSALEWLLYVDDSLIESRLYHGARTALYQSELTAVIAHLKADGWLEQPAASLQG